ncbi:MAG: FHA domain-containing protein [Lentisphaeria bacterium]|nr:MAG: FHA domain-containing protein [Lentisphaeria bacterium]
MGGLHVNYRIRFLAGELAGRTFAIQPSGTLIGRERNADIRPGGADIAAEHITLMPQSDSGVLLHVHGSESAWVNGEEISGGGDVLLTPGADVRIGRELTFVLEPDESRVAAAPDIDAGEAEEQTEELTEDSTAAADAAPADGECTRYASRRRA